MHAQPSINRRSPNIASPSKILASAQADRVVLQDYLPLGESIEWELGQRYWQERGSQAFISESVPFVINNDGNLSRQAAELLFAGLCANDPGSDILVLEIGVGVGLFARFFLDSLQALCRDHGKDFYERTHYVVADRSERMLADAGRHGIFANHPGRYVLRPTDALDPEASLYQAVAPFTDARRPFHAVFLNYILDCLPATALRFDKEQVQHLCARICLARALELKDYTDLTAEDLALRAQSNDQRLRRELGELSEVFAAEYAYLPVERKDVPFCDFVQGYARSKPGCFLLNHGAIQCLEALLGMLDEQHGFILINDYGSAKETEAEDNIEHQRFSGSTAFGLNFALLKAYFGGQKKCVWVEPTEDNASIFTRLMGHKPAKAVMDKFHEHFGKQPYEKLHESHILARNLIQSGRFEAATSAYGAAMEREAHNWVLMAEVAKFLTFTLKTPKAGLALARAALALNPACSADLWNTLGDSHFYLGEMDEARRAFERALQINPHDVRSFFNLAFVFAQQKDYASALKMIARGLALDQTGEYREGLLQKQAEVLAALARRQQRGWQLMANRISKALGRETTNSRQADQAVTNQPAAGIRPQGPEIFQQNSFAPNI